MSQKEDITQEDKEANKKALEALDDYKKETMPELPKYNKIDIQKAISSIKKDGLLGYDICFKKINEHLSGLRGFCVLAGTSNVGKTSFALHMFCNAIQKKQEDDKKPKVVYFSFDMSRLDIERRLGQIQTKTKYRDLPAIKQADFSEIQDRFILYDSKAISSIFTQRKQAGADTSRISIIYDIVKQESTSGEVIVCVDYFHCLISELLAEGGTTNDSERKLVDNLLIPLHDIEAVKSLVVITEKRKGTTDSKAKDLGLDDLMGSARLGYAPDNIIALQESESILAGNGKEWVIKEDNQDHNIIACTILKARDGGRRTRQPIYFLFEYTKNIFHDLGDTDGVNDIKFIEAESDCIATNILVPQDRTNDKQEKRSKKKKKKEWENMTPEELEEYEKIPN